MSNTSEIFPATQVRTSHSKESTNDFNVFSAENDFSEKTFADFQLSEKIVSALAKKGITHPFPIQALTLPIALKGADIIGQAKTGTGKTLGFGLPMLEKIISPNDQRFSKLQDPGAPQGLIVVPTRELAKQVAGDLRDAAANLSVRIVEVYGGMPYAPQHQQLKRGAEIVVGTPGRLIDLRKHGVLILSQVQIAVLDEADEMLDLGFFEAVSEILDATSSHRQTMLFSATMPGAVISMARRYMNHPTHIRAQDPDDASTTVKDVTQLVYRCHELNKVEVIVRILQAANRGLTIIFTKTKRQAGQLADELSTRGFATGALHGNLGQAVRERALRAFRKGKIDVLVATDVAARGIDIENVTHVVNYQCPEDEKIYLHRIGRTGRAGHKGTAVTFVDWEDIPRWGFINKILGLNLPVPIETYHTSEHLYTDLNIPADAGARLARAKQIRAGLEAEEIEDFAVPRRGKRNRARRKSRSAHSNSGGKGAVQKIQKEQGTRRSKQETQKRDTANQSRRKRKRIVQREFAANTPVKANTTSQQPDSLPSSRKRKTRARRRLN